MKKILFFTLCCAVLTAFAAPHKIFRTRDMILMENFSCDDDLKMNWELVKIDGAEGFMKVDYDVVTPTGNPTLKLVKTNNKGILLVRYKADLRDIPAGDYMISGHYHCENAQPDNAVFFRFIREGFPLYQYDSTLNSGHTYTCFSQAVNSPAHFWQPTRYFARIKESDRNKKKFQLGIMLLGSPCQVNFDQVAMIRAEKRAHDSFVALDSLHLLPLRYENRPVISEEEAIKRVKNRKPATIEIKKEGRGLRFYIDGKVSAPIMYLTQTANPRDHFREMYEAGVPIHYLHVGAGGNRKKGFNIIANGLDKIDYSVPDKAIIKALRHIPDATLVLRVTFGGYPGFENLPDEIWQDKNGLLGVSSNGDMNAVHRFVKEKSGTEEYYPSYASETWRKNCADVLVAYVEHLKETGLFNAFAGFDFCIGEDGQFLTGYHRRDFSPAARKGFAKYLQKKYGTVENLRKAWNNPKAEFNFPTRESLPDFDSTSGKAFLNPKKDQAVIDALRYHNDMQLEAAEYFRKRLEEAAGRPMYTHIMTPGSFDKSWIDLVSAGETGFNSLRDCVGYVYRRPGRPASPNAAYDTMRENGVMIINELDLRTNGSRTADEMDIEDDGRATTPAMFRTILNRITGFQIARGMGYWYYDMDQYFAQNKEILEIIKENSVIANRIARKPADTFKPDVAVVLDHDAVFYHTFGKLAYPTTLLFSNYLYASGVPFDFYYSNDFFRNAKERSDYKTIIFLTKLEMNDQQRQVIESLKNNNRTLVFLYPAGLLDPVKGFRLKDASKLMGINLTMNGTGLLTQEPVGKHPLAQNTEAVWGLADMVTFRVWHFSDQEYMKFIIDDPKATVISKFLHGGEAASAVKKFDNWTSIYLGAPDALTAGLMNNIAKFNGSFIAIDKPGVNMAMRDCFISMHALRGDDYTVKFPQKGKIINSVTGEVLAENSDTVKIHLKAGETLWLEQE